MQVLDFENHVVNLTNSSRSTFDTCRRKFFYSNLMDGCGIRPYGGSTGALLIGNVIHEMYAACLRGTDSTDEIMAAGYKVIREAEEEIVESNEKIEKNFAKASAIVQGAPEVIRATSHQLMEKMEVEAVEEHMSMELGRIKVNEEPWTVILHGKLDVLMSSKADGSLCVVDHKTVSAFKASFYERCLFDHQLTTYAMLAVGDNWAPKCAINVAYNVFRKPMLRQKKLETIEEWAGRIRDYYATTDISEYCRVLEFNRTGQQMFETMQVYLDVAYDIVYQSLTGRWRQEMHSCDLYSGCPYLSICSGVDNGGINFVPKKSAHEELITVDDEW